MEVAPTPTVRKRRKPAIELEPADGSPNPADREELAVAIAGSIEAILFSVDRPVPAARLAQAVLHAGESACDDDDATCTKEDQALVERVVELLNAEYERSGRSFRVESVSGGFRVMTLPQHAEAVASFKRARLSTRLTRAAVETLAIIAYRQPITRAELEAIRGVACGEVLKSLMDRRLVTIKGRAEELGRPMLYGTSKQFLDHFGLASIKDLPQVADLRVASPAEQSGPAGLPDVRPEPAPSQGAQP